MFRICVRSTRRSTLSQTDAERIRGFFYNYYYYYDCRLRTRTRTRIEFDTRVSAETKWFALSRGKVCAVNRKTAAREGLRENGRFLFSSRVGCGERSVRGCDDAVKFSGIHQRRAAVGLRRIYNAAEEFDFSNCVGPEQNLWPLRADGRRPLFIRTNWTAYLSAINKTVRQSEPTAGLRREEWYNTPA